VAEVWNPERVGVRLSPLSQFNDIKDDKPEMTFGYVAEKLSSYKLAYLHIVNPALPSLEKGTDPEPRAAQMIELIRKKYRGTLMVTGGFDHDTAEGWLQRGMADLIGFGRKYIANPDLPERFRQRAQLNKDDPTTYYTGGPRGYVDYPSLAQERGEEPLPTIDDRWR
jgi:N-ethylmaleimide reductase